MSYYNRESSRYIDGSRMHQTPEDRARQDYVQGLLEGEWGWKLHNRGPIAELDWSVEVDGRPAGYIELKCRLHSVNEWPNVWLNTRKYQAMCSARDREGLPSIFVVMFHDAILWIHHHEIDATRQRYGGCTHRVKSDTDIEGVIEIPVSSMRPINLHPWEFGVDRPSVPLAKLLRRGRHGTPNIAPVQASANAADRVAPAGESYPRRQDGHRQGV